MDMKKAALALAVLAVGFVAGYGAGRVSTGTPINPLSLSGNKGGYEEGYAAAAKKIADAGVLPPAPTEAFALRGTIISADAASIVFDADLRSSNPLQDLNGPTRRTAHLTAQTKIVRLEQRNAEELAAAEAEFEASLAAGKPGAPPSPTKQIPMTAPLKAGDHVIVEAGSNVLPSASFDAVTIIVALEP